MIRLSEAYARLELNLTVEPKHVKEAYRLLSCSILKLEKPNIELLDPEMEDLSAGMHRVNIRDEKLVRLKIFRMNINVKNKKRRNLKI